MSPRPLPTARSNNSPPRGRPRSHRAHAAILDASIALTREVGYDAVTMEAIAARASVGKATVYRHWRSKELIITEAVTRMVRSVPVPDTGTVDGDIRLLMRVTTAMYRDPATGLLLSGLVAAMARSEQVAATVRNGFVEAWRDAARFVLRRAVSRGELPTRLDVELALDLFSGPPFYRYLMLGRPVDERFTRAVVATVLRGLRAAATPRSRTAGKRT